MSLKEKSVVGFAWSFIDSLGNQGAQFVIGIVLARILTPKDFGIVGITTVFLAVSQSFIDSGFTQALIRKQNATRQDFSTVFYFNLAVGFLCYLLLFLLAPVISRFFHEPALTGVIKVLGITVIISSLAIIQRANLIKNINFRLQSKISVSSNLVSGAIGILLALKGVGVWSLVWRSLLNSFFQTILFWIFNKWKPTWEFDRKSFKEMFGFGSNLLINGVIDRIYLNIYYFVIAKYFTPAELGLYTRADQFKNLFSQNLDATIQKVSYPILASIQEDDIRLKAGYRKIFQLSTFISMILMLGMASVAKPLILLLIGEKWIGSIVYLQLLCLAFVLYPLHALNLNVLKVKGRSDLVLKLGLIKKMMVVPALIIGIFWGIKIMLVVMIGNSIIGFFINSQYSGRLIDYSAFDQIKDVSGSMCIAVGISVWLFIMGNMLDLAPVSLLPILIANGFGLLVLIGEKFKITEYQELKSIISERLKSGKSAYEN